MNEISIVYKVIIDLNLPERPKCVKCLIKEIYSKFEEPPKIKIEKMILLDDNDIKHIGETYKNATEEEEGIPEVV